MIQALTKKKFIVSMQKEASIVTLLALELKDSGEVLEIWRKKTNSKGTILDIKTNGGRILLSKSSDSGNSLVMELSPETGETIRTLSNPSLNQHKFRFRVIREELVGNFYRFEFLCCQSRETKRPSFFLIDLGSIYIHY